MLAMFPDSHLLSFQDLQNSLGMRRVLTQFFLFNFAVYENVMRWVGPENGAKSVCLLYQQNLILVLPLCTGTAFGGDATSSTQMSDFSSF